MADANAAENSVQGAPAFVSPKNPTGNSQIWPVYVPTDGVLFSFS